MTNEGHPGIPGNFAASEKSLGYLRLCNGMYDLGDLQNREKHISNWQVNKCPGDKKVRVSL